MLVNADDYGMDTEATQGILAAFRDGVVNSTSMWVLGGVPPALPTGLAVGLHVSLTEGTPLRGGRFPSGFELLTLDEDFGDEIEAQFQLYQKMTGSPPGHVDSHQYAT